MREFSVQEQYQRFVGFINDKVDIADDGKDDLMNQTRISFALFADGVQFPELTERQVSYCEEMQFKDEVKPKLSYWLDYIP